MAQRNINNFRTTLSAALSSGASSMVIPNADALRLKTEVFDLSDTALLSLELGTLREIVAVSAQVQDTPSTGLATVTIDTRAVEKVSGATATAQTFPSGATVLGSLTAAQIQVLRGGAGGGGAGVVSTQAAGATPLNITLSGDDVIFTEGGASGGTDVINLTIPGNAGNTIQAAYGVRIYHVGVSPGGQLQINTIHDTTSGLRSGHTAQIIDDGGFNIEYWELLIVVPVDAADDYAYIAIANNLNP